MEELVIKNASAVFAIVGALLGSIVTGVFGYLGKSRETKLKLAEKIIDKKLNAHDQIINLANSIRTMHVVEGTHEGTELPRFPVLLSSRKQFDDFFDYMGQIHAQSDRWLSAELKRELYFFTDYLVTLRKWTEQVNDFGLPRLGVALLNDFIEISNRIESAAHDFINNDIVKINFKTDRRWHKFKPDVTHKMLSDTILLKRELELQLIVDGKIT